MVTTAVASGFFVFVLSVVQGENQWAATYSSTQICALKGSTVEIRCTYKYPFRVNYHDTVVEKTFWFIKQQENEPEDMRTDSEYSGRVQYHCHNNNCTLTITDLRESDSGVYKFRFTTNQEGGKYTGEPGVTLSVTGLEVQIQELSLCRFESCHSLVLTCHSSCLPSYHPSYIWYNNGHNFGKDTFSLKSYFYSKDTISCAVKGHEDFPSPSLCVYGQSCHRVNYADRRICAFKGSSVDISCSYNKHAYSRSKVWFTQRQQPRRIQPVVQTGRVRVLETERGRSTLRITELRETDSAQYYFTFKTPIFEWRSSLPGTTLTVIDPDLQVQVILTSFGPKLICHSSCFLSGRSSFVWKKNEKEIHGETSASFSGHVDPEDSYSCFYEIYHSPQVYAPKVVSLLMSLSDDIMKDSSVNLTCSSDANPAAKYTWYKENQPLINKEPQLVFNSIQSSDSGQYHCAAENELGRRTSENISINVKYAPKLPSVSVSPSGQILEGSSVNLTCSSDANPAAKYTWYKENQTLHQGPEGFYSFSSISSEDRGIYTCRSENQFGQINSTSLSLDVQYPPKLPSVSVSPSGQIVEGSSVNLTCSSDANPAAKYTWYKEDEDSPKASGQIFTITDFRPEHSGNYYCEAQNTMGRQRSTLNLTVGAEKSGKIMNITRLTLVVLTPLLGLSLWTRKKKTVSLKTEANEAVEMMMVDSSPDYENMTTAAQTGDTEEQDLERTVSYKMDQ